MRWPGTPLHHATDTQRAGIRDIWFLPSLVGLELICFCFFLTLFFLVPSKGPPNLQLLNVHSDQVKVQWDPISQQHANGRILGYSVYVHESDFFPWFIKTVKTKRPSDHMMILKGLKEAQGYKISVAALTSKGVGPQSYQYITTGN